MCTVWLQFSCRLLVRPLGLEPSTLRAQLPGSIKYTHAHTPAQEQHQPGNFHQGRGVITARLRQNKALHHRLLHVYRMEACKQHSNANTWGRSGLMAGDEQATTPLCAWAPSTHTYQTHMCAHSTCAHYGARVEQSPSLHSHMHSL